MNRKICPITNQPIDCNNCDEIKDGQICLMWEPEETAFNWSMRVASLIRKRIENENS
uniref:Uncharacterized protein n=2 Tax=viral metagenome TaxID=1070528 RepID=A0A6M3JSL8_9ZZZZ